MASTTHHQHNNIHGGNNNNNFANGIQNIHKGRDWLQNNSTGQIHVNNYGHEDSDDEDDEGRPLLPKELQKELRAFKRQRTGELSDDELKKIDGQEYLDRWQRMIISDLPGNTLSPADKNAILDAMIRLSKVSGLSPKCLSIQDVGIKDLNPVPLQAAEDKNAELETLKGKIDNLDVTVKALKQAGPDDKELGMLLKHALAWQKLNHSNIVPFLGLYYYDESRSRVCLVYQWIEQLSLDEHAIDNKEGFAKGILDGVKHLHNENIIHGDLRRSSLLAPRGKPPRIADLGLTQVLGKNAKSDRYQCARVLYKEVFGGLSTKKPPTIPPGMSDETWEVVKEWLRTDMSSQPTV
ncbi:hypothetical protein PM082_013329 [Marasmius tenuissimus]|nr:hypothetical protein PM082_013329 [Marasmius tenuissimus]